MDWSALSTPGREQVYQEQKQMAGLGSLGSKSGAG